MGAACGVHPRLRSRAGGVRATLGGYFNACGGHYVKVGKKIR